MNRDRRRSVTIWRFTFSTHVDVTITRWRGSELRRQKSYRNIASKNIEHLEDVLHTGTYLGRPENIQVAYTARGDGDVAIMLDAAVEGELQ